MIEITLPDGSNTGVPQNVFDLLVGLREGAQNPQELPKFWNLSRAMTSYSDTFLEFYGFMVSNGRLSHAQLFQDLFVLFMLEGKERGRFLEFGATDGVKRSNSLLLEKSFGWTGVLAEPSPQWHEALRRNRPEAEIVTDCIYATTGETLDFFVSENGELSTLEQFRQSDATSMPGNAKSRNAKGHHHKVHSLALNDLFKRHMDDAPIDYMSVDTEGSELLILETFDFARYGPKIITVEHNHSDAEAGLDQLLAKNGYQRYFTAYTQFDAWYVKHANA